MRVQTILAVCVIGMIVTGIALYDAVTGDVTEWVDGLRTAQCDCHCLHRVYVD